MDVSIALGRLIAGGLVIADKLMGYFVTANFWVYGAMEANAEATDCGVAAYEAALTNCGTFLVQQLSILIVNLVALGGNILPALGV